MGEAPADWQLGKRGDRRTKGGEDPIHASKHIRYGINGVRGQCAHLQIICN